MTLGSPTVEDTPSHVVGKLWVNLLVFFFFCWKTLIFLPSPSLSRMGLVTLRWPRILQCMTQIQFPFWCIGHLEHLAICSSCHCLCNLCNTPKPHQAIFLRLGLTRQTPMHDTTVSLNGVAEIQSTRRGDASS